MRRQLETITEWDEKWDYSRFSSPAEFVEWVGTDCPKGVSIRRGEENWVGMRSQKLSDFFTTGHSIDAMQAFQTAKARLHQEHKLGGGVRPDVAGGAWVMPLVINGQPLPARTKIRGKLAPRNIVFRMSVPAMIDASVIAETGAKMARALWDYQMAGGAVTLTYWIPTRYTRKSERGTVGFIAEISIPFASESAVALVTSAVFYRGAFLTACQELTPIYKDSLKHEWRNRPGVIFFNGSADHDNAELAKMGVEL